MKNIKILIIILLVFSSCNKFSNPTLKLENLDELNLVYAQSIKFPTDNFDIIVFKPLIYECGNMSEEEISNIYSPDLLQKPFLDVIKGISNKRIIDESEFDKFKNTKENKVLYLSIDGVVKNYKEVTIRENYEFIDGSKFEYFKLEKHLVLKNGKWELKRNIKYF
ncbi:MAG: hypothetical protein K9I26_01495 [Flavobacterium sp.]|nr:hypothetical protein [Flavobacterium sp.]